MTVLSPILDVAWAERIGWTLVHSLWQIIIVSAGFALVTLLLRHRSANARYWLGCAGLVAMVVWPAVTFVNLEIVDTIAQRSPAIPAVPMSEEMALIASAVPNETTPPPTVGRAPRPFELRTPVVSGRPIWLQIESKLDEWGERSRFALPWLSAGWLLGVLVLAMRPLWGLVVVRRLKTQGLAPLSTELRKLAGRLMVRLRVHAAVEFAESALVEVPTVVGYLRPIVLLPASAVTGLSTEQLELVLAHELAHVRRHDYLVNLLQTSIEALLFYHPGMWWVSSQVRCEREYCCDDLAMAECGNRGQYIRALYSLESRRGGKVPALAASGGSLIRRVQRLVGGPEAEIGSDHTNAWLAGLLVLGTVSTVCLLRQAHAHDPSTGRDEVFVAAPATGAAPQRIVTEAAGSRIQYPGELAQPTSAPTATSASRHPDPSKPWLAVGRVTDADDKPMSGVEVKAFAGAGTLLLTGTSTTDANGHYLLEFGPGIRFSQGSNFLQAATIGAKAAGYFEQNMNRQGGCVAGYEEPDAEDLARWNRSPDQVFLPGAPKTIDFVMLPAAVLEGEFVETSHNWNVREQSFYLTGEQLPPSSNVLATVDTDDQGRFRVDGVPTGREWRIGMRVPHTGVDIETLPIEFDEPGVYRCKLLLETKSGDGGVQMSLRVDGLERVATVEQVREIDRLDGEGFSKLHRAAAGGHTDRARELLSAGANVNAEQGTYHGTPLQYAASAGHGEMVQALVDHGASVDAQDANGRTPLYWAATKGHADVIRRLLDAGAEINAANDGGWTPLHSAVDHSHVDTAQLLIDRGANVHQRNSQGKTPVDLNPELNLVIPWRALQRPEPELLRTRKSSITEPTESGDLYQAR